MKRRISILLAAVICLSIGLTACNQQPDTTGSSKRTNLGGWGGDPPLQNSTTN